MKYCLALALLVFGCAGRNGKDANSYPTVHPDRIMLTIPGDPATSRAVTWRTVFNDTVSMGEIAETDPAPEQEERARAVTGTHAPWKEGSREAMGHRVIFGNLEPDTRYAYRVGDGENWSEWFQFRTSSDRVSPFSFLYLGDVQNDILSYGSRVLRQAYSHFPDAEFMLFAGDLVKESSEEYWREFFYAGGWIFGTMPSVPTPGNHEYDEHPFRTRTFSKHWNQIYALPDNGPSEKFRNRLYYIDYQGVRFISVDSPAYGADRDDDETILDWLDETLAGNPCRWAVVFSHYPIYFCCQGREEKSYQSPAKTLLEKHGVDIVLQGHDHAYCRGQNLPAADPGARNHPVYVVSVAGKKMYGLSTDFWADRVASNTQLYQKIAFNGDTLRFKAFTAAGDLYDHFYLIKDEKGLNRLIEPEELSGMEQRTEIPEGEEEEYSDEDMQKYRQKYPDLSNTPYTWEH